MNPSPFAYFIVDTLLRRLRILSEPQIEALAKRFELTKEVHREIATLERSGLVHSFQVEIKTLQLERPIAVWHPESSPTPAFGKLSWIAKSRYQKTNAVYTKLFFASVAAERRYGGVGGSIRQPNQIMHDLGTSSTFVSRYEAVEPVGEWIGEDMIRRFFRHLKTRKIPDAAIVSDRGIEKAIEFAGKDYSKQYLLKFHNFWAQRKTPYEIW